MYQNDNDDTPRSNTYASPRDDRFYSPRTQALVKTHSNSTSEEWVTPRYESPRFSDGEYITPRMYGNQSDKKQQSGVSPRMYDDFYQSSRYKDDKDTYNVSNMRFINHNGSKSNAPTTYDPQSDPPNYSSESKYHPSSSSRSVGGYRIDEGEKEDGSDYLEFESDNHGFYQSEVDDIFSYARHGRVEEIEKLLGKGLPVDVRDTYGNTLLIIACQNGNKRVAKAVLRRGANINARNHKGNTPLHYCCHYGYGDSLGQYIISKGADADARNNVGKTVWQGI